MPARRNLFGWGSKPEKKRKAKRKVAVKEKSTPWYGSKVTYHRDVAKERRDLRRHAMEERKERLAQKKQDAAERAQAIREDKMSAAEDAKAERQRKAERRKEDAQDRKIEQEMRESGARNPTWGYGVYTPGFMGESQVAHFKSRGAAETYVRSRDIRGAKIKRAFAKNPMRPATMNGRRRRRNDGGEATGAGAGGAGGGAGAGSQGGKSSTDVRSPTRTSTSTEAETTGNITVTGGAGAGANTKVTIVKSNPLYRKLKTELRKNSRNPVDSAGSLSESWHGRPAHTATDYPENIHYHGVLTDLGRLKEIMVMVDDRRGQTISFDAHTRLASSENGKQLYVVGGDQSIDLGALGIKGEEAKKDLVYVGPVHHIVYVTAKDHLGKADKVSGPYVHKLGEDSGVMPVVLYDTLNETLSFAGGNYFIDATDYDGRHSAGIRD
jgi:hypothetical protein